MSLLNLLSSGTLEGYEDYLKMTKGLAKELKLSDAYGYETASGKYIPHKSLSSNKAKSLLKRCMVLTRNSFKDCTMVCLRLILTPGCHNMPTNFYKATLNLIRKYIDDYANMDYMRATRYLVILLAVN